MKGPAITIEYAPHHRSRGLIAGPWLFAIAVVSVAAGYLPFVHVIFISISAIDAFGEICNCVRQRNWHRLWQDPYLMSIPLLLAPLMAYLIGRVTWGRLARAERWAGLAMAALCAAILVAYSWMTGAELVHTAITQGFDDPILFILLGPALLAAIVVLAAGAVMGLQLRRTHKPGVGLCVFLMACYVANAAWALTFAGYSWWQGGLQTVRSGAVVCGVAATWYAIEMALLGWDGAAARRRAVPEEAASAG
jgi:hypothetical protein